MPNPELSRLLTIGLGGWAIRWGRGHSLQHYGDTWKGHLYQMAPDAVGIDLTGIEELVRLSLSGPMVDSELPPNSVRKLTLQPPDLIVPWVDEPATPETDPRFGNARALDHVSVDVYLTIVRRFPGHRIFSPHAEGACSGVLVGGVKYGSRFAQCPVCNRTDHPDGDGTPCNGPRKARS